MKYTQRFFAASSKRTTAAFLLSILVFSIAVSRVALAQTAITLTAANTPLKAGAMTELIFDTTKLAVPSKGANQTWNYGSTALQTSFADQIFPSTDKAFTSAAVFDTIGEDVLVSSGSESYGIPYDEVFDMGTSSIVEPGISVPANGYNIDEISGGTNDSLWVPAQDAMFSTPVNYLAFPATMGSTWSTANATRTIDMQVRVAALALLYGTGKIDFKKISSFSITDTVIGWGNLTVPSMSGSGATTPVLMVKMNEVRVDSFYLNGSIAPAIILSEFHLKQDTVSSYYSYAFYAQGSFAPLLKIYYSGPNYTVPMSAESYQSTSAGVAEPSQAQGIQIYPNPATSSLSIANSSGPFTIIDPLGRSYDVRQNTNTLDVSSLAPGVYFVSNGQWREKFIKE